MTRQSNKVLLLIITVLLLTNIGVLVYFLKYRQCEPEMAKPKGAVDLLKEQVGFSDAQLEHYKKVREQQRETIRPMYEKMRTTKDSLYRLLGDSTITDARIDTLAGNIGERQKTLDLLTFHQFRELRKICRPDQRILYDSMMAQLFYRNSKTFKSNKDEKK
ncbi:MAG: periplasmic heavy metal sensor [Chitinophagaceae bacterium]|nr:MAG: periplasmic heavy metal sensor [Chitinophagaceae bacterium]